MASTGSAALDRIVERLGSAADPKRRYEYVLWLAKRLEPLPDELRSEERKVRGCVSQVYVVGDLVEGKLHWQGDSDAQITKGLLALLIEGLEGLTPNQVVAIDPAFIAATGLQASLTPSRANGFLTSSGPCRPRRQPSRLGDGLRSKPGTSRAAAARDRPGAAARVKGLGSALGAGLGESAAWRRSRRGPKALPADF